MEGDRRLRVSCLAHWKISIHSLRMEGDMPYLSETHPMQSHFNPLPPHGGRHWCDEHGIDFEDISIHSLRMEGDSTTGTADRPRAAFQSTPSAWRETPPLHILLYYKMHFNPLPPHGGRPRNRYDSAVYKHFNPLPPHGGRRNVTSDFWRC